MQVNLIIDGNFLFYKNAHVAKKAVGSRTFLSREADKKDLIKRVTTELYYEINRFLTSGDRVIFVADSPSWRKQLQDAEHYKSSREQERKKSNIDHVKLYETISEYRTFIESMGGTFSQVENAEGDDLILYWSNHFLEHGESSIIVSADKDLHALCKFERNNFVAIWSKYSKYLKFICAEGTMDFLRKRDEITLMNLGGMFQNDYKQNLVRAIKKIDAEIIEVSTNKLNFNKVLIGDTSDSIPSVVQKTKGQRTYKLTDRKCSKLWDRFKERTGKEPQVIQILEDENLQEVLSILALEEMGVDATSDKLEKAKTNLAMNLKLIFLSDDVVPDYVSDEIKNHIEVESAMLHPFQMLPKKQLLEKAGVEDKPESFFDF